MVHEIVVNGYEELKTQMESLRENEETKSKQIFVLYTGDKTESGKSWCPDCVDAEPVIKCNLGLLDDNSVFITCFVGDRET